MAPASCCSCDGPANVETSHALASIRGRLAQTLALQHLVGRPYRLCGGGRAAGVSQVWRHRTRPADPASHSLLNAAGVLALASTLPRRRAHAAASWRWAWGIAVACQVALLALHYQLDRLLETSAGDGEAFYRWHQAYLWCTTILWLAGGWLVAADPADVHPASAQP